MGYIKNRELLLSAGEVELRRLALDIAEAGIAAADPGVAVHRHLRLDGDRGGDQGGSRDDGRLIVGDRVFDLSGGRRIFVIGAGKATFPIAKALDDILGPRIHKGLVTCKYGQGGTLSHIALRLADHPVPDQSSLDAATETARLLREVRPGDIVLACFTGGSSSLFVSPVPGVSLADKAATGRILLTCGANIIEINAVRKHLSTVKGGRLVRSLPAGVTLVNLTVSDVIGDRLDYITDPSVPDTSSFADAQATLDKYGLWDRLPASVAAHLGAAPVAAATADAGGLAHLDRMDLLLVHNDAACTGAAAAVRALGLTPLLLSTVFEGESSTLGRTMVAVAKQIQADGNPVPAPCVLIGGGETTVTISGAAGEGGPNQEFAVGAAVELDGMRGVVAIGLDTDGTDGPTGYAGGLADGRTVSIARSAGHDLHRALRLHDVTPALRDSGHILSTGATGTNVNDLKLVLVVPSA